MFNKHEIARNACRLYGGQAKCGYDWWWHSFTAHHEKTGEEKAFFIEFFLCNPASGGSPTISNEEQITLTADAIMALMKDEKGAQNDNNSTVIPGHYAKHT